MPARPPRRPTPRARTGRAAVALVAGWLALGVAAGCGKESTAPTPAATHPSMYLGLVPSSAAGAPSDSIGSALLTARATGVDLFYCGLTWADFEPSYGQYKSTELRNLLTAVDGLGFSTFIDFHVIETNQRIMPADIAGYAFDDTRVTARLDAALDTVLAIARSHRLLAFALGNEVDVYFNTHSTEFAGFKGLFAHTLTRLHAGWPGLPVGAVTTSPVGNANPAWGDTLHGMGDLSIYTYYPFQGGDFVHRLPGTLDGDMLAMQTRVPGKPFALQEIGYSSSQVNSPDALYPGDSLQADFVRRFRAWSAGRPRTTCLFANWFLYTDLSPAVVDSLTQFYGLDTPGFRGYLGGLGLRAFDGTPKRAWNAWRGLP